MATHTTPLIQDDDPLLHYRGPLLGALILASIYDLNTPIFVV